MTTDKCEGCGSSPCICACTDKDCPHYGTPHAHAGKTDTGVLYGQVNDPTGDTRHTGKWLQEVARAQDAELTQEVPTDVTFNVTGTDTERLAARLYSEGTALQVVEHIMALYGLKIQRTEDAEMIVELDSLHGALWFREYWMRDHEGKVVKHGKPVADMPGWVVAFEESLRPKDQLPMCYICEERVKEGERVEPHKHPVTGAMLVKHAYDCAL